MGTRLRFSSKSWDRRSRSWGTIRRDLIPPTWPPGGEGRGSWRSRSVACWRRGSNREELGNTLERLFIEFEEVPVRVGPFTQSHQAVLPGGRPALLVVDRTGVRRDLLAMRPVADLTRRRLGDRLPLDLRVRG